MNTPICDFVESYNAAQPIRMHMPGHKGCGYPLDITEIRGADELYHSEGIIRESEENAAALFNSARTVYSCEGSSLCIRAMLHMASLEVRSHGFVPKVLAGRNAHKAFLYACALLDIDPEWISGNANSLLSCDITPEFLDRRLADSHANIVYITSPDYAGHMNDVAALSQVCHQHGALLLVDNAHGAYLRFLPVSMHPMDLGADMCCDSAHKTLPVLTGGAYLHINRNAPMTLAEYAESAFALFASTSPSYMILQSLDRANAILDSDEYKCSLASTLQKVEDLKAKLRSQNWTFEGIEPMKISLLTQAYGYTGDEVHDRLRTSGIECEYSDHERVIMMPSPSNTDRDFAVIEKALLTLSPRKPVTAQPPIPGQPSKVLTVREAMLAPRVSCPAEDSIGHILADACVSCPPCVPILMPGETITPSAVSCMRFYGIDRVFILKD